MEEEYPHTLTQSEIVALNRRRQEDDATSFTSAERGYLISELVRLRRKTREQIITLLMDANASSRENRVKEELAVAAGDISDIILLVYDGLDHAILETSAYVTNHDDEASGNLGKKHMHEYLLAQAADANDFYLYRGYTLLASYFEEPEV